MRPPDENGATTRDRSWSGARQKGPTAPALRPWPEDRQEFERELLRKLGLLRREIDGLRRRLRHTERSTRADYADVLDALEFKADRLRRQVERFAAATGNNWEVTRTEAVETWRRLKRHLIRVALALHQHRSGSDTDKTAKRPSR